MFIRVVQKKTFFFKFNPSAPQIVRLVIETPHTKFQLIRFTGRGGHAFQNFEFLSTNMDFSSILALIFSVKMPGMLAFLDSILLISHNKTILNQFVVFVL